MLENDHDDSIAVNLLINKQSLSALVPSQGYRGTRHMGLWELQEPGQRDGHEHKDFSEKVMYHLKLEGSVGMSHN